MSEGGGIKKKQDFDVKARRKETVKKDLDISRRKI
jgi:hypothetical protein